MQKTVLNDVFELLQQIGAVELWPNLVFEHLN